MRNCDMTQKPCVSMYAPDSPCKRVYANDIWWSEQWNPLEYGREYDFLRPFFAQWHDLFIEVPKLALINDNNVKSQNSEFTNDFLLGKNCYFIFCGWFIENTYYGNICTGDKDCADLLFCWDCENVYEGVDLTKCSNSFFLVNSSSSSFCAFSYDLKNCTNCLFCSGLRGKSYCIENKQYTKEEYEVYLRDYCQPTSHQWMDAARQKLETLMVAAPRRAMNLRNCQDSLGDYLVDCKNTFGFGAVGAEDCRYVLAVDRPKNSYDISYSGAPEFAYECGTNDESYGCKFCIFSGQNSTNLTYCYNCYACKDCFGCVSLRNKQYCIFNKQYTKEEYAMLLPKIIESMAAAGEWGEFFPTEMAPFGYNETNALEFFPMSEEAVRAKGWKWRPKDLKEYQPAQYVMKDLVTDEQEDMTRATLACAQCCKNYRVIPQELALHMQQKVALPRLCFECRHLARTARRNPLGNFFLYERPCGQCGVQLQTGFSPGRPERILCDTCYEKVIY